MILSTHVIAAILTELHENDSDDDSDSRHVCTITVFLPVKFLYLLIYSLDYLFRFIQTLTMFTDFINFIVIFLSIACYLLNLFLKLIFSH